MDGNAVMWLIVVGIIAALVWAYRHGRLAGYLQKVKEAEAKIGVSAPGWLASIEAKLGGKVAIPTPAVVPVSLALPDTPDIVAAKQALAAAIINASIRPMRAPRRSSSSRIAS